MEVESRGQTGWCEEGTVRRGGVRPLGRLGVSSSEVTTPDVLPTGGGGAREGRR